MNNHPVKKVFVYGSLRKGFHSPVYEYISRFFTYEGEARVRGRLYDMGTYPAGIPDKADVYIIGELYRITNENEFSWALAQLDDYEGVIVEAGEVPLYRREITDVFINGEITTAWIYWYNAEVSGKRVIESGDMLEYLKQHK
jgi:gamma-glutamylcyclotransferase (GGCT)/AIG2-like uncharacterized protein YtfP